MIPTFMKVEYWTEKKNYKNTFFARESNPIRALAQLNVACLRWDNTLGAIFGRVDDHDRGDKTQSSTRGERGNSRAHAYRP